MSVRWIAVQYVGDTLRLPIVDNDTMDKPFGSTVLERPISKIVVNPFSEKPRTFVEKREHLDSGSAIEMLRTFLTMSPSVVYPDEVLEHLQAVEDEVCEVRRSFEDSIEYLRQENIDWEDRYRELAKENANLRELVRQDYGFIKYLNECEAYPSSKDISFHEYQVRELGIEVE